MIYGETIISSNITTNSSGGGISLIHSNLDIHANCIISGNHAANGGGIHASSSTIALYQSGTLNIINNRANNGGGLYLVNTKLYILTSRIQNESLRHDFIEPLCSILLRDNHASYGGAIFVVDDANFGACQPDNECFIQTFRLYGFQTTAAEQAGMVLL